jgi:hypothetical protein
MLPAVRNAVFAGARRVVADGAVGGRPVLIALRVRRFRCQQPSCPEVTFAGQAEGLTSRYRRLLLAGPPPRMIYPARAVGGE